MIDNIIDFIQHTAPTFFSVVIARLIEKGCEKCKEEGEEPIVEEQVSIEHESDTETTDSQEENNL